MRDIKAKKILNPSRPIGMIRRQRYSNGKFPWLCSDYHSSDQVPGLNEKCPMLCRAESTLPRHANKLASSIIRLQ